MTPAPTATACPTVLDLAMPLVLAYPRETVIAEKPEAIVELDMDNMVIRHLQLVCGNANAWEQDRNSSVAKIDWQVTAADARNKLKRLYPKL